MLEEEIEQMKKKLAKEIKICRKKIGITQEELAKKMKVSQPFMSKIEKGDSLPEKHTLIKLARALDLGDEHFVKSLTFKKADETGEILNILRGLETVIRQKDVRDQLIPVSHFNSEGKIRVEEVELPVGAGECFTDDCVVGEHWLPSSIAYGATHLIRVSGKSMEPFIMDGELILVAKQNFVERDGQMAVVNVGNQFNSVKFVYIAEDRIGIGRSREDASWYSKDEVRIQGIVVNKISSYNVIRGMEDSANQN
jgi:transcriptional regulator with XRE-family HTH domain